MISKDSITDVLSRSDIVHEIGSRIELKKAGTNFVGLCPFHGEKSPSFSVSPSKQFYHCFGCGAHGDVIEFLTQHDGMDFQEAVEDLGSRLGVTIKHEVRDGKDAPGAQRTQAQVARQEQLLQMCAAAQEHFRRNLGNSAAAQRYAQERELTADVSEKYGIGFALAEFNGLASAFGDQAYDNDPLLLEAGLVGVLEKGARTGQRYDRFRDRLMFPIRSTKGQVIGFGGRTINDNNPKAPKYLNSPETPLFKKHLVLYGLHEARASIMRNKMAFVTEGYMDVVGMAMHGQENAVATMGTAFTEDHARVLLRFTRRVCFLFDGDAAGQAAAWKAVQTVIGLATANTNFQFLTLPDAMDPDEFLKAFGAEAFHKLLATHGKSMSQFILDKLKAMHGRDGQLDTLEARSAFMQEGMALAEKIPAENSLQMLLMQEIEKIAHPDGLGPASQLASRVPTASQAPLSPAQRLRQMISGGGKAAGSSRAWLPPEEFKAMKSRERQQSGGVATSDHKYAPRTFPHFSASAERAALPSRNQDIWEELAKACALAPDYAFSISGKLMSLVDMSKPQELALVKALDAIEASETELASPQSAKPDDIQAAKDLLTSAGEIIARLRKKEAALELRKQFEAGAMDEATYLAESMRCM